VAVHQALLSYAGPPEGADHFLLPVYVSCNFSTPNGFPSLSHARGLLADAVELVRSDMPYWNRSGGADHVFVASHDFRACFHPMVSCQSFHLFLCSDPHCGCVCLNFNLACK
jgi:probable glucuronoxylan glucuronosyltransferase IRX7